MTKELSVHIAAVHELRKRIKDGWRFWHTPNGELGGRFLSKLMAMGLLPGVPDLILFSADGRAFFLEFKSADGVLSDAQKDFREWAMGAGLRYAVARTVSEAMTIFESFGAIPE
jgi:VRR-NUC domain